MKTLEIFLDESGAINERKPMNISGVVVLAPDIDSRNKFHRSFFAKLVAEKMTVGICDLVDNQKPTISPTEFLPKRPQPGDTGSDFWEKVIHISALAEKSASENQTEILTFTLEFPTSSIRRWCAVNSAEDFLLDRPYGEYLKHVLELLLFETPRLRDAIASQSGCSLGIDLPTRALGMNLEQGLHSSTRTQMWNNWGVVAWSGSDPKTRQPQVVANSLEPSDGIEILSAVVNRRKVGLPDTVKVERIRCCKLANWDEWDGKYNFQNNQRPRQIHYLADYISHGILHRQVHINQAATESLFGECSNEPWFNRAPFLSWYSRGFLLSSVDENADSWIIAARANANDARIDALLEIAKICSNARILHTDTFRFFKQSAKDWPDKIRGTELRELFYKMG